MENPINAVEKKISDAAGSLAGSPAQNAASGQGSINLEELAEILLQKLREEIFLENQRTGRG